MRLCIVELRGDGTATRGHPIGARAARAEIVAQHRNADLAHGLYCGDEVQQFFIAARGASADVFGTSRRHGLVHGDRKSHLGPFLLLLAHGRGVLIAAYFFEGRRCYAAGDAHFPADLHPLGLLARAPA